ncbi:histone-fold-containing protein [Suillus clintonianus]|uniref:histone-fold-containing protein n=1 Tax=Suillus clintonianus TaxID=1904413 RepID=UPI001B86A288|nr:histone-fold-containing protein [Suillus clintonianus]KAG2134528.1 histone-fold-containing protein [Suillus clintonianus]
MSPTTPYVQSGEPLNDFLRSFWQRQVDAAEQETPDYRHPPLPLARIKKVMKSDPDVKMIAADAPILFCKACEIFISEITARAFIIADSNKRRTLSRADIAKALAKSDQFDFLIDIVPREEGLTGLTQSSAGAGAIAGGSGSSMTNLVAGPSQAAPHQDSEHHAGDESGNLPSAVVLDQLQSLLAPSNAMHAS